MQIRARHLAMVVVAGCLAAMGAVCGEPYGLTVERLKNPYGVDASVPRFGWKMSVEKDARDVVQSAYRIVVASSKEKLAHDDGDLWDSGKVSGAESIDVMYGGKPLASSRRYWWKVRTWDGKGVESTWSAPAAWVTGILPSEGWKAKWIGPAPETRPDADLGGARWITATPNAKGDVVINMDFDFAGAKPGEYVELLHAASTRHEIDVNGHEFHRHSGQVDRWNHLRFRDMTPWLKVGKNTMTVRVKKGAKGVSQAFICAIRFPDGRRIVTNGTRGKDLGALRDTPYGKALVTREEIASPAFEKKFTVAKPVASAILHVTGVGFYEASLNGRKIGDKVLDPSPTAYDKRVLYSTYDLGGALKPGENTLKVLVGHGWYDVRSIAVWNFDVAPWRDFPRMIAQLEIAYVDGSRETIISDGSWRQVESPVGYDCIREGEVIGAHNPAQPDFAKREIHAAEVPAPKGALVAENCPGAKVIRTIAPKAIHAFPDGTYVVEFPKNFAGWIRMDVRGQKQGDVLVIRYDERANKDFSPARSSAPDGLHTFRGSLRGLDVGSATRRIDCHFRYTASQRVCATGAEFQTDRFVSSGAEVERYEPHFTYNGFQYVVLKGLRTAPRKEDITGCVVHTDFPAIGSFSCSDETFNTLMKMGDRAYRSNFADGYPTDCPHREKNGWTGDASIASELAQYCYENTAGYEKWLNDIMDSQLANGDICGIVPTSGWGYKWGNGPAWDSALPVVAWNLWCYRGDRHTLDAVYPALKHYVDFTTTKARGNLVRHGIGDWNHVNRKHVPSVELTSSCYYRQAAAILSRMASVKGLADDEARYAKLADAIKDAINAKFYKGGGVYDNGRQTAQAFPLAFGVVPESERDAVEEKLVESVEKEGCHVDVGLLGSKHVFRALSRIGRTDLAFKMLTNPTKPSPVEWIQKGGTTLWEDWGDGASRNHIMFGDFMAWAYQYIGGIQLPEKEGSCAAIPNVAATAFKEVVIVPQFIKELSWAKARVDGPYGAIETSWRREGEDVTLDVTVPPNTTAIIRLPGEPDRRVGSGTYSFTVRVVPLTQTETHLDNQSAVKFNSNWPVRGKRVININTVVRVNQIEVSRTANRGHDEAHLHTVEAVETFRKAVSDAIPEAKVTWAFSWLALQDPRPNYVAVRKRVVEYHSQYGDEITFIPGAYFAPMYNSRAQTNRDIHDGLKLVGEMVGGGYRPHGIVAGFLAADNMRFLAEEEGIHVAQGTIWSQYGIDNGDGDGSISYPYYPSLEHACKPAQCKADFIDCVNLDGWTCDFLCARKFGFEGGGNSRTGVGPIETYGRLGIKNGMKETRAVVRSHFGENFKRNGFGWIVVNWEICLVKLNRPEYTAALTQWLKGVREEFPDTIVPLMSEFGEAWRRENPNNDRLDYRFVQRGNCIHRIFSEPNLEIRWYMNRKFRLATLRDWTKNEPEMVIDFTRYDLPAKEPPDASVKKPTRNWSLINRINQKRRRPEDAPIPLSALTDEERRLVDEYYQPPATGK